MGSCKSESCCGDCGCVLEPESRLDCRYCETALCAVCGDSHICEDENLDPWLDFIADSEYQGGGLYDSDDR